MDYFRGVLGILVVFYEPLFKDFYVRFLGSFSLFFQLGFGLRRDKRVTPLSPPRVCSWILSILQFINSSKFSLHYHVYFNSFLFLFINHDLLELGF